MLGWEFFVLRRDNERKTPRSAVALARWRAGIGGTRWLEDLVSKGLAEDLGGDGYPSRYTVGARALVELLTQGLPQHDGPFVVGDDYVLPGGWTGDSKIEFESLRALDPTETLLVEAWDQS